LPDDLALQPTAAPGVALAAPSSAGSDVYFTTARDGLNLRSGPGPEFPIVRSLAFGTRVHLLRREGRWGLIDEQGDGASDGFVHLAFLDQQASTSAGPDAFVPINRSLLQTIMNRCAGGRVVSTLNLDVVADALTRAMLLAEANNRRREVGFLSQSVIETDFFETFHEYGSGRGKAYAPYYGRGMHQLTWKDTYRACSRAVFGDDRLVNNPNLILDDIEVNIKATAWYWRDYKPFNSLADDENVDEIIYRLYGGRITSPKAAVRESVLRRRSYYKTIKEILSHF
jgi:predicted chitinase